MNRTVVVVPNWNGADSLRDCLDSLLSQSLQPHIIVVDNGSVDGSSELVEKHYPSVELIKHTTNKGYAGGVNSGLRRAIDMESEYVAAFNNDAVADKRWLEHLVDFMNAHKGTGITTCKLLSRDGTQLDSTGEAYSVWGLPYPRGRNEPNSDKYDTQTEIFAASGGATLYRVKMLEQIGLFDEDFFAYYEDVDLSFRAQLASWKVTYVPSALAYHQIGATSGRLRGFTTYQTFKNLPMLLIKNVPSKYLWRVTWRYSLVQALFFGRAILRGHGWAALKGKSRCVYLFTGNLRKRQQIQQAKEVSDAYIWNIMVHDLPPNARAVRKLRTAWWRLRGKRA